jgi:hypothetical protein
MMRSAGGAQRQQRQCRRLPIGGTIIRRVFQKAQPSLLQLPCVWTRAFTLIAMKWRAVLISEAHLQR